MTLTPERKLAIEWTCHRLALSFFAHNDAGEYDALAALFTEDGEFARPTDPDNPVRGRQAIHEAFVSRPGGRVTRHVCSNLLVEALSEDRARGSMYVVLYMGEAGDTAKLGVRAKPVQLVGEYHDEYRLTDEGWRIARRTGNVTFTVDGSGA